MDLTDGYSCILLTRLPNKANKVVDTLYRLLCTRDNLNKGHKCTEVKYTQLRN